MVQKVEREPIGLNELQSIELNILVAFHNFCQQNGLRYYLAGGTALGAIRHHGFIPWDDDIDVIMPRPDYMKLLKLARQKQIFGEDYIASNFYLDNDLPVQATTTRIFDSRTEVTFDNFRISFQIGCWIDIFAIDGLPSSRFYRNLRFRTVRILLDLLYCDVTKFGGKRRSTLISILQYFLAPVVGIARLIGYRRIINAIEKICLKSAYENSEWVGVLGGRAAEKEAMKKINLEPAVLVDFEGNKFQIMANYHEYLTNLYGDYMTPPKEKVSRHLIQAYWK